MARPSPSATPPSRALLQLWFGRVAPQKSGVTHRVAAVITGELKSKIDRVWDAFWVVKISDVISGEFKPWELQPLLEAQAAAPTRKRIGPRANGTGASMKNVAQSKFADLAVQLVALGEQAAVDALSASNQSPAFKGEL